MVDEDDDGDRGGDGGDELGPSSPPSSRRLTCPITLESPPPAPALVTPCGHVFGAVALTAHFLSKGSGAAAEGTAAAAGAAGAPPAAGPCPLCCGPPISQRELRPARIRRGPRAAREGDVVRFVLLRRLKATGSNGNKAPSLLSSPPLSEASSGGGGRATRVDGREEEVMRRRQQQQQQQQQQRNPASPSAVPPSYDLFNRETPVSDAAWLWREQGAALGEALEAEAEDAAGHGHSLLARAARSSARRFRCSLTDGAADKSSGMGGGA